MGDSTKGVIKGDTRSLDHGSHLKLQSRHPKYQTLTLNAKLNTFSPKPKGKTGEPDPQPYGISGLEFRVSGLGFRV